MQPADIGRLVTVSDPRVSPDGSLVAFVVTRVDLDENRYRSAVWLAAVDGSAPPYPFTAGEHGDGRPVWSPDGRRLAFTSRRSGTEGASTLHVAPVHGPGEVITLCERPEAVEDPGTGWGGVDAEDLLAVVDAALGRWSFLDAGRVGVLGGSYGGYMTSWLVGHTDRFAAACSERAANNLLSLEWSSDSAGHFRYLIGVDALEQPEAYLRMSPVTYARDITTPLLVLHSEDDLRCPVEQADQLFVALRRLGRAVEYWRFPAESHELTRSGSPGTACSAPR